MEMHLFRLSLKEKRQADVFARRDFTGQIYTREDWIKDYFSERREFLHRGLTFAYVPEPNAQLPRPGMLAGWIARARVLQEWTAPSEGLQPTHHESWRVALILIDPTDHEDGQKISFEQSLDVGTAKPIMKSLVQGMNNQSDHETFSAEAFPLIEELSFWRFSEAHGNQINFLSFDVAVPNMFDGPDDFTSELNKLKTLNNVSRVKSTLTSDGIIETKAPNIAPIIDYTEKGLGTIKARATDGARYNSQNYALRITIEAEHTDGAGDLFWAKLSSALRGIFK